MQQVIDQLSMIRSCCLEKKWYTRNQIKRDINEAIAMIQTFRYITPEQYKAETGKEWPDDAAVYCRPFRTGGWIIKKWGPHRKSWVENSWQVICAYLNDGPPPEGWVAE